MAHAITASSTRYDRMSPVAAALAAVLHVATALALFLVSPLNRHNVDVDNAIDVTIEQPKPPQEAVKPTPPPQPPAVQPAPPPPPPAAQAQRPEPKLQPQTTPKERLGLPPEAPVEPDKKTEAKPQPKVEAKLEPKPEPPPEPKAEPKQEAAAQPAEPTPPPAKEKPLEKVLPPVEPPAAPLTMRDFVKAVPPRPAPPPSPPVRRPAPPQQHAQPQPQPSPLSQRPPATEQRQASVSTFQNPAAAYNHARVHDDYLIGIARRMSQYRFVPQSMKGLSAQGVVVLNLVVARDGRLLNAAIAKSSGNRPMDQAVLETAQKAAPYGPLPPEISGNSAAFTLSVPFRFVAEQ